MALSLSGERPHVAASRAYPFRALFAWVAEVNAARARRNALKALLQLDHDRLNDLGISRGDITDAMAARNGRTPGMTLHAARARNSRR